MKKSYQRFFIITEISQGAPFDLIHGRLPSKDAKNDGISD